MYVSGNKIYANAFDQGPSITEIKGLVETKFGISLRDIAKLNNNAAMLAAALNRDEISSAQIIDGAKYKDLTIRAFLVPSDLTATPYNAAGSDERLESFEFKLPKHNVKVVMIATDEWAGQKDDG